MQSGRHEDTRQVDVYLTYKINVVNSSATDAIYVSQINDIHSDKMEIVQQEIKKEIQQDPTTNIEKQGVKLEEEISELESEEEKKEFLEMMGLDKSGLDRLVIASYDILGLMSYLTVRRNRSKSMDYKKRDKSTKSGIKDTFRYRKRVYKSGNCII